MGSGSPPEGEAIVNPNQMGGLKIGDATRRGGFAWEDHVFNIVDMEVEGGVAQDDLLVGGEEESIGVETAMHANRFESGGQAGDMEPPMFFHNLVAQKETDGTSLPATGMASPLAAVIKESDTGV